VATEAQGAGDCQVPVEAKAKGLVLERRPLLRDLALSLSF